MGKTELPNTPKRETLNAKALDGTLTTNIESFWIGADGFPGAFLGLLLMESRLAAGQPLCSTGLPFYSSKQEILTNPISKVAHSALFNGYYFSIAT